VAGPPGALAFQACEGRAQPVLQRVFQLQLVAVALDLIEGLSLLVQRYEMAGNDLLASVSGTKSVSKHSWQGCGRAGSLKFRQDGESGNAEVAFEGVRTLRPRPPCSRKLSSNLSTFEKVAFVVGHGKVPAVE